MLALRDLLMYGGLGMILVALGILGYDLYRELLYRKALATAGVAPMPAAPTWRWRTSLGLLLLAWGPILLAFSIVVIPSGKAGGRGRPSSQAMARSCAPLHGARCFFSKARGGTTAGRGPHHAETSE